MGYYELQQTVNEFVLDTAMSLDEKPLSEAQLTKLVNSYIRKVARTKEGKLDLADVLGLKKVENILPCLCRRVKNTQKIK
jgi:3-deoxy-D-arabino-heptulosonate 7-phosphate (DAHP) synthase class II